LFWFFLYKTIDLCKWLATWTPINKHSCWFYWLNHIRGIFFLTCFDKFRWAIRHLTNIFWKLANTIVLTHNNFRLPVYFKRRTTSNKCFPFIVVVIGFISQTTQHTISSSNSSFFLHLMYALPHQISCISNTKLSIIKQIWPKTSFHRHSSTNIQINFIPIIFIFNTKYLTPIALTVISFNKMFIIRQILI
jgi:hypothetical protein